MLILFLSLFSACEGWGIKQKRKNAEIEYLLPNQEDLSTPDFGIPYPQKLPPYSWEERYVGRLPRINKEFFRCRGSYSNAPRDIQEGNRDKGQYVDCGGSAQHGLPLKDEQEFVYPVLIDILNTLQEKTGKRVVITCGHRCPLHNSYADSSPSNRASKHMIAAEVDFYVEGMESQPEKIVELILKLYPEESFHRYTKQDTNVRIQPWYNHEIFVKLYQRDEGRDLDNRHSYPYIGVQVRSHEGKRVSYTWEQATRYYRR